MNACSFCFSFSYHLVYTSPFLPRYLLGGGWTLLNFNYPFCCFGTKYFSNIFDSSLIGYRNTTLGRLLLGYRNRAGLSNKRHIVQNIRAILSLRCQRSERLALIEPIVQLDINKISASSAHETDIYIC